MSEKHVTQGALCKCSLGSVPCTLMVTSQTIKKIEGKLQATERDKTFMGTFGTCNISSPPPPCVIILQIWNNTSSKTSLQDKQALLEKSTINCTRGGTVSIINPNQNTTKTSELPEIEIKKVFSGELHFRRILYPIDYNTGIFIEKEKKGEYAIFEKRTYKNHKVQTYGFDWFRDLLDGNDDFITPTANNTIKVINSIHGDYVSYIGRAIHHIEESKKNDRKIEQEHFFHCIQKMWIRSKEDRTIEKEINCLKIVEYNKNGFFKAEYKPDNKLYKEKAGLIGGNFYTAKGSILLSSIYDFIKEYAPIKKYINTPNGTKISGSNGANITHCINNKNYYTPWVSLFPKSSIKIQALTFVDETPPPGEIRFSCSSENITIIPKKISIPGVFSYPSTKQTKPIPESNIEIIEIKCNNEFDEHQIIEARFFDNKRISDPEYLGEIIGLLNIYKNNITHDIDYYLLPTYISDDENLIEVSTYKTQSKFNESIKNKPKLYNQYSRNHKENQIRRTTTVANMFRENGQKYQFTKLSIKQTLVNYIFKNDSSYTQPQKLDPKYLKEYDASYCKKKISHDLETDGFTNYIDTTYLLDQKLICKTGISLFILPIHDSTLAGLASDSLDDLSIPKYATIASDYFLDNNLRPDSSTTIHESLHTLGVHHTFYQFLNNKNKNNKYSPYYLDDLSKYCFIDNKTENIMDYSNFPISLFKWQWDIVLKNWIDYNEHNSK